MNFLSPFGERTFCQDDDVKFDLLTLVLAYYVYPMPCLAAQSQRTDASKDPVAVPMCCGKEAVHDQWR